MTTNPQQQPARPVLAEIARRILDLETLEARHSDRLDFHEQAVWSVREALEAAFEAGRKSVRKGGAR